jgi:hypothetical protein
MEELTGTEDQLVTIGPPLPWALAINDSTATSDANITLLSSTLCEDVLRLSGLIALHHPDLHLAHVPELELRPFRGAALRLLGSHLLPSRDRLWTTWFFERPEHVAGRYVATVASLDLARAGARLATVVPGAWRFGFELCEPRPGETATRPSQLEAR